SPPPPSLSPSSSSGPPFDLRVTCLHLVHVHLSTYFPIHLNVPHGPGGQGSQLELPSHWITYHSLVASIGYQGRWLGSVTSGNSRVRARRVSNVDVELELDRIQVIHDMFHLIEDYMSGSIPFDTITKVQGQLRLFFFDIPAQVG
ncbi:unnamed protein product, partial [Musa acuminata subsp. burmannicoides]